MPEKPLKKKHRPITEKRLERIAYSYLERFATSRENLRLVLERRVRRGNEGFSPPSHEQSGWIEALLDKCERLQLIDDAQYSQAKARSMVRQGKPQRAIRQWLKAKGLSEPDIEDAIDALADDMGDMKAIDVQAALAYARKRRFGPWRRGPLDESRHKKELAAFARTGYAYGLARSIIEAESIENAQSLIEDEDTQSRTLTSEFDEDSNMH